MIRKDSRFIPVVLYHFFSYKLNQDINKRIIWYGISNRIVSRAITGERSVLFLHHSVK